MGNWNITIQGVGQHHNHPSSEKDAEVMAADFVRKLQEAGHSISSATITHGGAQVLEPQPTPQPLSGGGPGEK